MATPHPNSDFSPVSPLTLHVSLPDSSSEPRILGIPADWNSWATPRIQKLYQIMLDKLAKAYNYNLVPIKIPFLVEGQLAHAMTMLTDASTLLPDASNIQHPNRILCALGRTTPSNDYLLAQKLRRLLMQHLSYLFKQHPGMIIVTPTAACEGWRIKNFKQEERYGISDGDTTLETMAYVWMANFCGLPSLACPIGFGADPSTGEENVPIGMMGMAEWGAEEELLQWGLDAEALSGDESVNRKPPIWVDVVERAKKEMSESGSGEVAG
jgi:Asp-tRNA(Asn)/Glu-tRNA(Gln) amidotransferase A subunit family amidase